MVVELSVVVIGSVAAAHAGAKQIHARAIIALTVSRLNKPTISNEIILNNPYV
jgi:hypothetical protein